VAAVLPFRTADGRRGVEVAAGGERWQLWLDVPRAPAVDAERIAAPEADETTSALRAALSGADNWFVTAPLSGKAGAHAAEAGDRVEAQATITTIEAMKMQHAVLAGRAARVVRWLIEPGTFARADQPLVELAPLEASSPG
jgi:biotin carboxyl carrier protein